MSKTIYIGIDVGKNGGICMLIPRDGTPFYEAVTHKCPSTPRDMATIFHYPPLVESIMDYNAICLIEKVHSMPKLGVKSMFTFGENYGIWQGILATVKVPYDLVPPQRWMKHYGSMPKDKKERKHYIKALAQRLYPDANVTLYTADAILIAHYLMQHHDKEIPAIDVDSMPSA